MWNISGAEVDEPDPFKVRIRIRNTESSGNYCMSHKSCPF